MIKIWFSFIQMEVGLSPCDETRESSISVLYWKIVDGSPDIYAIYYVVNGMKCNLWKNHHMLLEKCTVIFLKDWSNIPSLFHSLLQQIKYL